MKYYSASAKGFFCPSMHAENIPPDAVEISDEEWRALLEAQSRGKTIEADAHGAPVAVARAYAVTS